MRPSFQIPKPVEAALRVLETSKYTAYLVGGCVRDTLLGQEPSDYDIATDALPSQTEACFSGRYPVFRTGEKHGTVTAVVEGLPIEITTFRIDGAYRDNRRPESVRYTGSIREDLSRRDFTVNAMAYGIKSGLIDPFSGRRDLREKRIACVGDPDRRFREDGLRLLRALRFAGTLGFAIEEETSLGIRKNKELLRNISAERIYAEWIRLLCGAGAGRVLWEYAEVIGVRIPRAQTFGTGAAAALDRCGAEKTLRIAAYLRLIGYSARDAGALLRALRADGKTVGAVSLLIGGADTEILPGERGMKKFLSTVPFEQAAKAVEIKRALAAASGEEISGYAALLALIERLRGENSCVSLKMLAVNGDDLKALGIEEGEQIGALLRELLNRVIDGACANERDSLIAQIRSGICKN